MIFVRYDKEKYYPEDEQDLEHLLQALSTQFKTQVVLVTDLIKEIIKDGDVIYKRSDL